MKKITANILVILMLLQTSSAFAAQSAEIKKNPSSFYKDFFDHNIYYDNTAYLHFDRLGRLISRKKVRAANVNVYDEVTDSSFFTNRQGRKNLSGDDLTKGYEENLGPDLSGKLTIAGGQLEGLRPYFEVKDAKGDDYTIYFDASDSLGLTTGAMMVASRAYYAAGYNVPQITLITVSPDQLVPDADSRFIDVSGFRRKLTKDKIDELVLMLPWAEDGKFRACAVKTPEGEDKGPFNFQGRRKNVADDKWPHELLRELRALRVFASWLNDFEIRDGDTRSFLVSENGKTVLKNYLWGFKGALGSDVAGAKPPMLGHEYFYDAGETNKAALSLGFWEKPWQKRWSGNGETVSAPAVGYFDNKEFRADRFKTVLPLYTFKDVTRADGFWAAKIIKSFSDEQIKALVNSGKYTEAADADLIVKTLSERRDLIAQYWFSQSAPLDSFEVKSGELVFEDLAQKNSFESDGSYQVQVTSGDKKAKKLASFETKTSSIKVDPSWQNSEVKIWIRKVRSQDKKQPYVMVHLKNGSIAQIVHQD